MERVATIIRSQATAGSSFLRAFVSLQIAKMMQLVQIYYHSFVQDINLYQGMSDCSTSLSCRNRKNMIES